MRWILYPAALATVTIPALSSGADDGPVTREEHDRVLREIEDLRRDLAELRAGRPPEPRPMGTGADDSAEVVVGSAGPGGYQGLRDKPFLSTGGPRAYLGGYFDIEYRDAQNARHDFRFHRLIPFIYADIHERIQFATEIEIEDGGDVSVEFAFVDLKIIEEANFRGGVILEPLGKFNLIHDSPINDLTDRPLVSQFVIPTTFREIGVGLFGNLTPPEAEWDVKYEAYLTSGFKGLDDAGNTAISVNNGLRGARASEEGLGTRAYDDINNAFAGVGRVSVSPLLGSEVGVSAHTGTYDESSNNNLTIAAVDGLYTIPQFRVADIPVGPIEVLGEAAYAFIERDDLARASGIPGDLWGYYGQVNYHFMPSFLQDNLPELFLPESTFTLVGRWDHVDLDEARRYRVTAGLNFRPIEATVFKFDYQMNWGSGTAPQTTDDDAFLFSIASYF
jgi:hypothetical protein